ncbi:hypothetical protein Zmor_015191 [Zophobas morio]|uniref:Uncharacterized protein n=1 Tax=Zophobas morio TaxID=2755281 RepID=A0AA38MGB5_9CUCU|nr:hypothetical protein Zmor_015191 [Zophobas morio]
MEIRFLRGIDNKTSRDRISDMTISGQQNVKSIDIIIEERQLIWLGHIEWETRKRQKMFGGKNKRRLPRKNWVELVPNAAKKQQIRWIEVRRTAEDRIVWTKVLKKNNKEVRSHELHPDTNR